jgi:vitamin K-dependent gamma-carboxylase-like protein
MNHLLDRWDRFWFASIPPHVYALLRIVFGFVGCVTLFGLHDLSTLWFLDGLVPLDVGAVGLKQYLLGHGAGHTAGVLLYVSTLASFVAMTIGLQTRVAVPVALFASLMQVAWNYLPLSGADAAMRAFLFCLVWADCGSVWSLDAWLAARRHAAVSPVVESGSIAPLRLIRFQVALIYFNAGLWKIFNPYWRDGSAVHYVVQSNVYRRLPHGMPLAFDQLVSVLTYATLAWELTFAFLLFFSRTRRIALIAGILIHLGMLSTIEIGPFHVVMLTSYLAFLEPEDVPRLPDRLQFLLGRRARVPARVETAVNR